MSLSKGLLGSYVPNPQYTASDTIPVAVLPRDKLFFEQEIGEGCFGKVFKGENGPTTGLTSNILNSPNLQANSKEKMGPEKQ